MHPAKPMSEGSKTKIDASLWYSQCISFQGGWPVTTNDVQMKKWTVRRWWDNGLSQQLSTPRFFSSQSSPSPSPTPSHPHPPPHTLTLETMLIVLCDRRGSVHVWSIAFWGRCELKRRSSNDHCSSDWWFTKYTSKKNVEGQKVEGKTIK